MSTPPTTWHWFRVPMTLYDRLAEIGNAEPEAAALIGVKTHVLADARRRGEIAAKLVGKRYVYSRESLERYLEED